MAPGSLRSEGRAFGPGHGPNVVHRTLSRKFQVQFTAHAAGSRRPMGQMRRTRQASREAAAAGSVARRFRRRDAAGRAGVGPALGETAAREGAQAGCVAARGASSRGRGGRR